MRNLFFVAFLAALALVQACQKKSATTANGFELIYHKKNNGTAIQAGEKIKFHIYAFLNDSLVQSSRRDRGSAIETIVPDTAQMRGRNPDPVLDALLMLTIGDSATVYQKVDSVMALSIPPNFGKVEKIRYDIVILERAAKDAVAKEQEEAKKKMEAEAARGADVAKMVAQNLADYKSKKAKVQKTASGLEYIIHEQGTGAPIQDGDQVPTHYYGILQKDGKMFDNSFDRGMGPAPFQVGGLIPGFNEGMKLLNRGGKATLFIPSKIAYGTAGAGADIPPNADLVFYIEMGQ